MPEQVCCVELPVLVVHHDPGCHLDKVEVEEKEEVEFEEEMEMEDEVKVEDEVEDEVEVEVEVEDLPGWTVPSPTPGRQSPSWLQADFCLQ